MATRGHLRSGLHTIVLAILASGGVAHAATISIHPEVTAEAVYQGLSAGPISAVHGDPGAASVEAHAGPDEEAGILGSDTQVYDGAIAKARSQLDSSLSNSSVGTYAHAGGYSPGFASPPDAVHAVASVRWVLRFMVNAPSEVTTAQLNAELDVDGTLLAASYGGSRTPDDLWASVSARGPPPSPAWAPSTGSMPAPSSTGPASWSRPASGQVRSCTTSHRCSTATRWRR